MKTHTLYILILVAFFGFFGFFPKTQAQTVQNVPTYNPTSLSTPTSSVPTSGAVQNIPTYNPTSLSTPTTSVPISGAVQNIPTYNPNLSTNSNLSTTASTSSSCSGTGLAKIICQMQQLLNSIIPLLIALGVVYFIWGVVTYFINDEEEAKTKGRDRIIYGLIGLVIIIGLWGLVNLVVNTFGIGGQNIPTLSGLTPSQITTSQSACDLSGNPKFQNYLDYVSTCIINNSVIPLIFAVAVVMFVWGVVQFFILNSDEEAKREQGKQYMVWGIVALTVMLCVWGLVGILSSTFGLNKGGSILPQIHPQTSS